MSGLFSDESKRRQEVLRARDKELLKQLQESARYMGAPDKKITVDKRTHRIRFAEETEDVVTIIIEPKATSSL